MLPIPDLFAFASSPRQWLLLLMLWLSKVNFSFISLSVSSL
jgi:hypothetical protein